MTDVEYLEAVLRDQTLAPSGPELMDLQRQRENVERIIGDKLGHAQPTLRVGGSRAKNTMIREAFDLDLAVCFRHDQSGAGESLEEIFSTVADAINDDYYVERRRSALRLRSKDAERYREDTHVDLVPGRFFDESLADAWIYQNHAEKCRLKTNLDVHIEHIRDSGVRPAIRLGKLWNVQAGVGMKTFVLELLIVDLLKDRKTVSLPAQLLHALEQFRDNRQLSVVDPANGNNDLTPALDAVRSRLVSSAAGALGKIQNEGWQAVFGNVEEGKRREAAGKAAASIPLNSRYQPWVCGE